METQRRQAGIFAAALLILTSPTARSDCSTEGGSGLDIGQVAVSEKRLVNTEDISALRKIDSLSVSPDGREFAIFVHQGNPRTNRYRASWFVGAADGGNLRKVGDGGVVGLRTSVTGYQGGDIRGQESRWSPNGLWIAYPRECNGEVQLWRSRADGQRVEQLTHNDANVREFFWRADGDSLYFTVGDSRASIRSEEGAASRRGYRYNEELDSFADFMRPRLPRYVPEIDHVWVFSLKQRTERLATAAEQAEFNKLRQGNVLGDVDPNGFLANQVVTPVLSKRGAPAWLVRVNRFSRHLHLMARLSKSGRSIACAVPECVGIINKFWWSSDGEQVLFWRSEGISDRETAIYSWRPRTGKLENVLRASDDYFTLCDQARNGYIVCVRETKTRPAHIVSINTKTKNVEVVADVNPEFTNIRLGRVERFEWDTPKYPWNAPEGRLRGVYPTRAYGYILYPPDFNPKKQYPAFLDPYGVLGFDPSVGAEHSLHVYAANGFIVVNTGLPMPNAEAELLGAKAMKEEFSQELGFPHLTMLSESTLRGLDLAISITRGAIDPARVGAGGVSHGSFIPLYLMQAHPNRIAALSISSPNWGALQYFYATRRGMGALAASRLKVGSENWLVSPDDELRGREFWRAIDVADHVEMIRAPILMNLAAFETYGLLRLMRHLDEAGKPYDAYIFRDETHVKWQPAHLHAIMNRNLDWFRFWLQNYEDSNPDKRDQYAQWRELRANLVTSNSFGTSESSSQ